MSRATRPPLSTHKKLLFSAITVLLVLALLEGGSRLLMDSTTNVPWERQRHLVTVLGFPALNEILVPDPDLFWKLRPNLDRYRLSGRIADSSALSFSVSTDARGFRRTPPVIAAEWRVVFLGDSCTFGVGVDDDQTFPAWVQQRLPGVQCRNLGVPGYSAYQGRVLLEHYAFDAPPDVVVISFGFNDEAPWDTRSDLENAQRLAAEREGFAAHFRFVKLLQGVLPLRAPAASHTREGARPRLTDAEFQEQVRAMIAWCRQRGATPLLMLWPQKSQLREEGLLPKQAALLAVAQSERVGLVDLPAAFRAPGQPDLFLDAVHANAQGCEAVADTLVPILRYLRSAPGTAPTQATTAPGR